MVGDCCGGQKFETDNGEEDEMGTRARTWEWQTAQGKRALLCCCAF